MNRAEYSALFEDRHISDRERSLYLYLRWHMDYDTGIVGAARKISYQAIRENLEHKPERGSKEPPVYLTKDQVKRLLRKLERYGWIEPLHSKRPGECMVFRLVLATAGLLRPNEERHMSATVGAPQEKPIKMQVVSNMSATGAPQHERHTSDTSDIKPSLSNARVRESGDFEDLKTGKELQYNQQFRQIANITGLTYSDERLEGLFEAFRFTKKNRNQAQAMPDWLADWRVWCGREKSYGKSTTENNARAGGNQRAENPTARLLRESKEAAAELARTGYYDPGNQPDGDTEF